MRSGKEVINPAWFGIKLVFSDSTPLDGEELGVRSEG
jgi:hypothetical protein